MQLARTTCAHSERENVIGDPNETFGIGIEFDVADRTPLANRVSARQHRDRRDC
jgi:hypothetical protein